MGVTSEEDPCRTEPLPRATSGRECRRKLGGVLNPLSSPWPFAQWSLDIVGPFPKAAGNKRYLLVNTDYFTKWVKAEPLANIRDVDAKRFVWRNIVTRFKVS